MKIIWLGQAGLLLDNGKTRIMIDPYLSDSVRKADPQKYRRVPIKEEIFDVEPDVMIFTHDHLDHYDPQTAQVFLGEDRSPKTVLCPGSVWNKARQYSKKHNYVLFDTRTQWTEGGFRFCAVRAVHSDPCAIGVLIEELAENKIYYITGDTLYSEDIFSDLPENIDVVFLPVNGVGNNMNATDAVRFFKCCGARRAVPYHVGMLDDMSHGIFDVKEKIILEIYEEKEV